MSESQNNKQNNNTPGRGGRNRRRNNRNNQNSKDSNPNTPTKGNNKAGNVSNNSTPGSNKKRNRNRNRNRTRTRFQEYISVEKAEEGCRIGAYLSGRIRLHRDNAYVSVPGLSIDVYIDGKTNRNRAFENDTVVIKIIDDTSKWRVASGAPGKDEMNALDDEEDDVDVAETASQQTGYTPSIKRALAIIDDSNDVDELVNAVRKIDLNDESQPEHTMTENDAERMRKEIIHRLEHSFNESGERLQPSGAVVCIQSRMASNIAVGRLRTRKNDLNVDPNADFFMLIPNDQKLPTILLLGQSVPDEFKTNPKSFEKKLCSAEILKWGADSYQPLGRFQEVIGDLFNLKHETRALLVQYQIDVRPHGPKAMACLPDNCDQWTVPQEEIARRRDYRKNRVFTIDPATARDLDDALHIEKLENGNFEVGVHIADVTHFMPAGCALDHDASKRATTVYLGESNIPMLPRELCDNLCSLHPGVDRLAFSVVWELTPDAEIVREWFGHTVIRSCTKMAYGVAQAMIEDRLHDSWSEAFSEEDLKGMPDLGPFDDYSVTQIRQDVMNLWSLASKLRSNRYAGGAVSLNNVKLAFKFNDKNVPIEAYPYITKEANNMIEDFMLLANRRVGAKISRTFPKNALLRQHDAPVERSVANFAAFVKASLGIEMDISSSLTLAQSLATVSAKVPKEVFAALQDMATRSMQLAKYFSTGSVPANRWHHYALNMDRYTHFTSPIRRYADVLVHRQLHCALLIDSPPESGVVIDHQEESELIGHEQDKDALAAAAAAEAEARKADALTFSSLLSNDSLQAQANVCNDRKVAARKVQDGRGVLLLCLLVRDKPAYCDGVVMSIGDRFINIFVYQYGISEKCYMQDMSNINGWIWNDNNDSDQVAGENSSLVLQWTEDYDANDLAYSAKASQRAAAEDNDENDDNGDDVDEKERAMAARAKAKADQMEADAQLQDAHMAAVGRKNKRHAKIKADGGDDNNQEAGERVGQPSNLPSIEQKLHVLDKVRVKLSMRPDSMRAMLRISVLHPSHPHFVAQDEEVNATIEHEIEGD